MKQYEVTLYGNRSILVETKDIVAAILHVITKEQVDITKIRKVEQVRYSIGAEVSV